MNSDGFKRKLTAILSADVVGYSRLMGDDEPLTVKTLEAYKGAIFSLIKQHRDRVVDSPGDNLLADFMSVVDAVQCSVAVQKELQARNTDLPDNRRMQFRIGINLGDVIEEQDRIYGDGVNIAARLESLADPGGICISKTAFDYIENKLPLGYRFIGQQTVKNIPKPVAAYKVLMDPRVIDDVEEEDVKVERRCKSKHPLQDKPSIAVLPFVNMSNDPEQEYFSDGMTEELIGALAKLEGLKVISRTSAFYFKGKDVDLRTIGEKLNVDNVLEGSVRKAGNKLRITAQLINVADDTHLWSESYNRELIDIFDIQEEISLAIVQNLKVRLLGLKQEPLVKDYTNNTEAYELYLRGIYFFNKGALGFSKSIECFEKAIKLDPEYTPAYVYLSVSYLTDTIFGTRSPKEMWQKYNDLIQKAYELDETDFWVQLRLAWIKGFYDYDWKDLRTISKQSIELYPGLAYSHSNYAIVSIGAGQVNEAIKAMKVCLELDPFSTYYNSMFGFYLILASQFDQAILHLQKTLELSPNDPQVLAMLASADAGKGIYDEGIKNLQPFRNIPIFGSILGYLCAKAGRREEAQQILTDILDRSKRGYFSGYYTAIVYTGLGDQDNAFEQIERVYQERDPNNWLIRVDPAFSDLHSDPRWAEQMKKRGFAD